MAGSARRNRRARPERRGAATACRLFVYRVARDFGGDSMRYVWDRNAEKVTL